LSRHLFSQINSFRVYIEVFFTLGAKVFSLVLAQASVYICLYMVLLAFYY